MFDFLPATPHVALRHAPLQVAVAQVKFEYRPSLSKHAGASSFQEAVADDYPRLIAEPQSSITAGPGNLSASEVPQWRFTDLTNTWSCVVGPEQLTIETSSYSQWSTMRERVERAVTVLVDLAKPRIRERIGLRYINHIQPNDDGVFEEMIKSELLGVLGLSAWRNGLTTTVSQSIFKDGDAQLALRYGRGVPGQDEAFVLDIDCANETGLAFDLQQTMLYFDQLNDAALRAFSASLAQEYRATLFDSPANWEKESS